VSRTGGRGNESFACSRFGASLRTGGCGGRGGGVGVGVGVGCLTGAAGFDLSIMIPPDSLFLLTELYSYCGLLQLASSRHPLRELP